jgi:hypothetical protein
MEYWVSKKEKNIPTGPDNMAIIRSASNRVTLNWGQKYYIFGILDGSDGGLECQKERPK